MALWTLHNVPKYLTTTEKGLVDATKSGWEITYSNGNKELLVAIGQLTEKQIPKIVEITLNSSSYNLAASGYVIIFNVRYNFPITATLTSASVLPFTLGLGSLEAEYDATVDEYNLEFIYTIPTDSGELDAIMAVGETLTSLVTDDIVLDGTETILIDDTIFDSEYTGTTTINASLVSQYTIPVTIIRQPVI